MPNEMLRNILSWQVLVRNSDIEPFLESKCPYCYSKTKSTMLPFLYFWCGNCGKFYHDNDAEVLNQDQLDKQQEEQEEELFKVDLEYGDIIKEL